MSDTEQRSEVDPLVLRIRLTQLIQALQSSQTHNPATLEALKRIFPTLADTELPAQQPMLTRLKRWFHTRKAA